MTRAARRWLTGMAGGVALAITAGLTTTPAAQTDDHFRIGSQTKTFASVVVLQLVDEMPLSCGGVGWVKNGALPTGHTSITAATDDGHFASLVTNGLATGEEAAALSVGLLGSALCE
jgi:hypothetical protein